VFTVPGRVFSTAKRTVFKPLLVWKFLVAGEENVEAFTLDERQQRAVFDAASMHTGHGMNFLGQPPDGLRGTSSSNRTFKAAPEIRE